MKKTVTLLLFGTLAPALFMAFSVPSRIEIGSVLPKQNQVMKNVDGKDVKLGSQKKENGLLIMFSCNTCPYVIRNQQRTKEICSYAMKNKIGVVLLNSNEANRDDEDSQNAMKEYATRQGYQW